MYFYAKMRMNGWPFLAKLKHKYRFELPLHGQDLRFYFQFRVCNRSLQYDTAEKNCYRVRKPPVSQ